MENFIELTLNTGKNFLANPRKIKSMWIGDTCTIVLFSSKEHYKVTEPPAEIDAKISELKKRNSNPSQTDTLIVENLRAHLDKMIGTDKVMREMNIKPMFEDRITLLEEILSLQKPV